MSTGQTFVTICAMSLLLTLLLGIYQGFNSSGNVLLRSKCGIAAISISTSIIEEAQNKYFDKSTYDSAITKLSTLATPANLGPEAGDVYPKFDYFDEFNNFKDTLFFQLPDSFYVNCKVCYVDPSNLNVAASTQTWHKKITVNVTSPHLKDTVKAEYVFSYFYFR
ncbi:MAG: hypothetical protein ACHQQQ_12745 [Bacteroidota bacterium]